MPLKRNYDVETARRLLKKKNISNNVVTPSRLLSLSATMQKSLDETLNLISFLRMQGQGYSPFPLTAKALTGKYS